MNLTILFGASSFEHEISIVSAITMKKVLSAHNPKFIFVSAEREFYLIEAEKMKSSYFSSGGYRDSRVLHIEKGGFFYYAGLLGNKKSKIDTGVVLNLIHGRDGEDGKMASILDFYEIPYIGPGIEASVLSYSKRLSKCFAHSLGIDTLPYTVLERNGSREIEFDYPVIVKPVHLGSSIGVSIVHSDSELDYALDVAFEFDSEVLIEPFVDGIAEYNIAGCKTSVWELSIVEEPQKEEFLDFEKKYMDFSRDSRVNEAAIDNSVKSALEESFKKIYEPLFEGSIIRCDFFIHEGRVVLNEINPIPGSMANYLFDDFENMLERLAAHLPAQKRIKVDYRYIHSIQNAKGKA